MGHAAYPSWWVAATWLLASVILQVALAPYIAIRDTVPSFTLLAVMWYALRVDVGRAVLFGFVVGMIEDALSGGGGGWALATATVAALAGTLSRNFFADSIPLMAFVAAFGTFVRDGIYWIVELFEGYPSGMGTRHLHQSIVQSLYDAALAIVLVLLARHWERTRLS
ncbi:MAG: rod shape-determining protein MreD [Vulcanimicrobiaceae bacterium]